LIGGATPASQVVTVTTTPSGLTPGAAATVTTPAGGSWLGASLSGTALTVSVTPGTLPASVTPYAGFITLTLNGAPNVVIPVQLSVGASVITATPGALTFGYTVGGTIPTSQAVAVSTNPPGLTVTPTVTVTTPSGGTWLGATIAGGTLTVSATITGLTPATTTIYSGYITLAANGAPNVVIPVSLTVTPAQILAAPGSLGFTQQNPGGGNPPAQTITVSTNPSGLTITPTVAVTSPVGGTWLGATLTGGTLTVTATTGSLTNGSYSGSITLATSGAPSVTIPVTFTVGATAVISVNPSTTATFTAVTNATSGPAAQSLLVTVANGPIPLTLTPLVPSTLPAWLNATLVPSGVSTSTASLNLAIITPATAGSYSATLSIGSSQGGVTPVTVTVNLTVTTATISASPTTLPPFPYTLGGSTVTQTQTVTVTGTAGAVFTVSTSAGCGWVVPSQVGSVLPSQVILTVAGPGTNTTSQTGCIITYGIVGNTATATTSPTLTVNPQPIVTQPATDAFTYTWQGTPPTTVHSLPVTITNAASVTGLLLTPSGSCAWLTNSLASTTAPTSINTSINAAGVPTIPGAYTCMLTLSAGTGGSPVAPALYTTATTVTLTISPAPFFAGSLPAGSMLSLQFPSGIPFGYYAYTGGAWVFHLDLGYEYVVPANDASNGIYMYDLRSTHWFYTTPGSFPYLYDFTLRTWLYYFPASGVPFRYTSSPRTFANMTTGAIFNM
jgi:hypothetical protein